MNTELQFALMCSRGDRFVRIETGRPGLVKECVMVRNKPAGDAFTSNRRSPALLRRKRELEIKAGQEVGECGDLAPGALRRSLSSSSRLILLSSE